MDEAGLRALSLRLEKDTGCDSIPTIERVYMRDPDPGGPFLCAFNPYATYGQGRCTFRRRDPVAMWRHVHFGRTHGLSFGRTWQEILDAG